ncbi:MAG TPA: efflux RND transporter periplasmic adaptor subunit [Steroidobacteraceae bacterium]|jgi:HlyD family secretion protein|nr:efflux RND transporter periplasmic adaptor subunit [Steroidobacteraceae bacterium]
MRIPHSFFLATLVASVTCAAPPAAAQARAGSGSLAVSVTTPRTEQFARTVVATGSVYAWQEAVIGSEVGGYRVAAVNVDVGDKVRKGQELVRLANEMLSAEVAAKKAAKAQADAQLITASSNLRRAESILNSGAVSDAQHEQLKAEFLAAQARVAAAQSDLEGSQLKLQYTRVLAPDDGVITARTVVVGQIAQAGAEMLRLLRQSRVEWRAEVPEARMREVKVGQTARITTADGTQLVGKVRAVAPTVQSGTRTGLVYVDLPKSDDARPGMFARGEIEIARSASATLPLASVIVRDGYSYVFVVNDKQGVERRRIETGTVRDGRVEVLSGLQPTERVVERGAGFLKDGDRIRVVETDEPGSTSAARLPSGKGNT